MPLNALLPASRRVLSAEPAVVVATRPFGFLVTASPRCSPASSLARWPCLGLRPLTTPNVQLRWLSFNTRTRRSKTVVIKEKGWSSVRTRWDAPPKNWRKTIPIGNRRAMRRRTRSPNEYLIRVLGKQHDAWKLPRIHQGKANLSYVSDHSPHQWRHARHFHPYEQFRPSLQFYLARYLYVIHNGTFDWDTPIVPNVRVMLTRNGYTEDDFKIWGKILSADRALKATKALVSGQIDGLSISTPIPAWVLTLHTRRLDLSAHAVRRLVEYIRSVVTVETEQVHHASRDNITVDEKTFTLLCIRLLRRARIVHPDSIKDIAKLVVTRINPSHTGTIRETPRRELVKGGPLSKRHIHLTLLYNRMLTLLSLPTSSRPYVSAPLQLDSQFSILRRMAQYQPPLVITQAGYRAVARVQLAHPKTGEERKWAELKSKSWPPWKEDRTAMDSDIGPEHGLSRAGQSVLRMHEAGYPAFGWDRIIKLFAGWDSDGSPVIQTRKALPRIRNAMVSALDERRMPFEFACSRDEDHEIWAARVRTTRTVEESWAIFLAYDALVVPDAQQRLPAYLALFERIVGARKLLIRGRRKLATLRPGYVDKREVLPGDGREALPTPESEHERLDPRLQPPSVDELLERMISRGIHPDSKCLALLLQTVSRFDRGLNFILASRNERVRALLELEVTEQQAQAVPKEVFRAYIDLLCRNNSMPDRHHYVNGAPRGDGRALIHRAIALMDYRKSTYLPGWNRILLAIQKFDRTRQDNGTSELMRQSLKVLDRAGVELDVEGFQTVCLSFSLSAMVRRDRIAQSPKGSLEAAWAHHHQHNGKDSHYLRTLFNKVVGLDYSSYVNLSGDAASARKVLTVPSPAILHAYIRALGVMGDYEGLLSVASFMYENVAGLLHYCESELNGHVRLRRAVVALRCFLERSWEELPEQSWSNTENGEQGFDQPADQEVMMAVEPAPEELVMLVRDKVEDLATMWGGWPSDDEVMEYIMQGKMGKSL